MIASTCQLSCNVDITPHRINNKAHNFAMFSPITATAILNRRNQNCGQEPSSSVNSTRRTSPRLQPAAAHAHGGTSSQGLQSGVTTESRRHRGTNTNTAPRRKIRPPDSFDPHSSSSLSSSHLAASSSIPSVSLPCRRPRS